MERLIKRLTVVLKNNSNQILRSFEVQVGMDETGQVTGFLSDAHPFCVVMATLHMQSKITCYNYKTFSKLQAICSFVEYRFRSQTWPLCHPLGYGVYSPPLIEIKEEPRPTKKLTVVLKNKSNQILRSFEVEAGAKQAGYITDFLLAEQPFSVAIDTLQMQSRITCYNYKNFHKLQAICYFVQDRWYRFDRY